MVKIVSVALVCALLITYLKSVNSDLYTLAMLGAGIVIIALGFEYVSETFTFFNKIIALSGINKEFYLIIFKVTAIAYLVEFGAGTISDLGLKNIADKLVFVGKLVIFSISLPILYAVFNLISELIK